MIRWIYGAISESHLLLLAENQRQDFRMALEQRLLSLCYLIANFHKLFPFTSFNFSFASSDLWNLSSMTTYSLGFILSETMQYVHLRKNYIGSNVLSFIYEFNIISRSFKWCKLWCEGGMDQTWSSTSPNSLSVGCSLEILCSQLMSSNSQALSFQIWSDTVITESVTSLVVLKVDQFLFYFLFFICFYPFPFLQHRTQWLHKAPLY